jgi:hypothetical protein
MLDPDVASVFSTPESVDTALRALLKPYRRAVSIRHQLVYLGGIFADKYAINDGQTACAV